MHFTSVGECISQATDIALGRPRRGKPVFNFLDSQLTPRPAVGDDLGAESGVPETRHLVGTFRFTLLEN